MKASLEKRVAWIYARRTGRVVAIAAIAGFVCGYNSRAPKHPAETAVVRSPEIRRAIPVEPEIRKAIPVQTRDPVADLRSMAFTTPIRGEPSATLQHNARPCNARPQHLDAEPAVKRNLLNGGQRRINLFGSI